MSMHGPVVPGEAYPLEPASLATVAGLAEVMYDAATRNPGQFTGFDVTRKDDEIRFRAGHGANVGGELAIQPETDTRPVIICESSREIVGDGAGSWVRETRFYAPLRAGETVTREVHEGHVNSDGDLVDSVMVDIEPGLPLDEERCQGVLANLRTITAAAEQPRQPGHLRRLARAVGGLLRRERPEPLAAALAAENLQDPETVASVLHRVYDFAQLDVRAGGRTLEYNPDAHVAVVRDGTTRVEISLVDGLAVAVRSIVAQGTYINGVPHVGPSITTTQLYELQVAADNLEPHVDITRHVEGTPPDADLVESHPLNSDDYYRLASYAFGVLRQIEFGGRRGWRGLLNATRGVAADFRSMGLGLPPSELR